MLKPAIPTQPKEKGREQFDKSIKESLEVIMGRRGSKIAPLNEDASLSAVIAKINELLNVIQ